MKTGRQSVNVCKKTDRQSATNHLDIQAIKTFVSFTSYIDCVLIEFACGVKMLIFM